MHLLSVPAVVGLLAATGALAVPSPQAQSAPITLTMLGGACNLPYYGARVGNRPNINPGTWDNIFKNCLARVDPERRFTTPYVEQLRNRDRARHGLPLAPPSSPLYPEGYQASNRQQPEEVGLPPIIPRYQGASSVPPAPPASRNQNNAGTNRPTVMDTRVNRAVRNPVPPRQQVATDDDTKVWNPAATRNTAGLDRARRARQAYQRAREAQQAAARSQARPNSVQGNNRASASAPIRE